MSNQSINKELNDIEDIVLKLDTLSKKSINDEKESSNNNCSCIIPFNSKIVLPQGFKYTPATDNNPNHARFVITNHCLRTVTGVAKIPFKFNDQILTTEPRRIKKIFGSLTYMTGVTVSGLLGINLINNNSGNTFTPNTETKSNKLSQEQDKIFVCYSNSITVNKIIQIENIPLEHNQHDNDDNIYDTEIDLDNINTELVEYKIYEDTTLYSNDSDIRIITIIGKLKLII